jgi:hypothetical protein
VYRVPEFFIMCPVSCTACAACIEFERTDVPADRIDTDQSDEQMFVSVLADLSRMLWPKKTAANIAAVTGCSVRAAQFYLDGQRDWSGDALAAIVAEVLKRHAKRNIRVMSRDASHPPQSQSMDQRRRVGNSR